MPATTPSYRVERPGIVRQLDVWSILKIVVVESRAAQSAKMGGGGGELGGMRGGVASCMA